MTHVVLSIDSGESVDPDSSNGAFNIIEVPELLRCFVSLLLFRLSSNRAYSNFIRRWSIDISDIVAYWRRDSN